MIYTKIIIPLAYIAATNAYNIKFDVLGFGPISEDQEMDVEAQILEQYYKHEAGQRAQKVQERFQIDWNGIDVDRVVGEMKYDIPGRVGRERCFNIIPPIFTQSTPEVTTRDRYRANNLMAADDEYFPPEFLLNPIQRSGDPPDWDEASQLGLAASPKLPEVDITGITILSRLDPDAWETLGPAGPPPLAIALYSKRDCLSKGHTHNPEAVIRYFEGEGTQFVSMDKLSPNTGAIQAQSWEELDPDSDWWSAAIGGVPIPPKARDTQGGSSPLALGRAASMGPDTTAVDNGLGEEISSTRTDAGDVYLSAKGNGPPRYVRGVVETSLKGGLGGYMAADVLDSMQAMKQNWPEIEDYGYGGSNRMNPRVKATGLEYLDADWATGVGADPDAGTSLSPEVDTDGYETVDAGRSKPKDKAYEPTLYNPLRDPLPKEKLRTAPQLVSEGESSEESIPPPLLRPLSSEENKIPQVQDILELSAQSNTGPVLSPDFEGLGLSPEQENADAIGPWSDTSDEDFVNELDELE
ncbi:hypothetical protein TWF506_001915 [Arthrobotrys conoides]|uniref:Uncharacterized protein n=1 Tax=Arthrobotrys conoides TaxID=74498 RepID=A0AAN8P3M7_9PEZI